MRSLVCLAVACLALAAAQPLAPIDLRLEYRESPVLGVDVPSPRFSWVLQHTARAVKQSQYQILLSSTATGSGDVWNSGPVSSNVSTNVPLPSTVNLQSDTSYFWKVRWSDGSSFSPYSDVAEFDTGLFSPSDWKATWIGGANQLRTEFSLQQAVVRARLFIVGLGYYVVNINGQRLGPNVLGTFTTFQKRILYDVYDVTELLSFNNAIAVSLGHGWYAQPTVNVGPISLLAQLSLTYENGTREYVLSDFSWKVAQGPIVADDIYIGETDDYRNSTPGWDLPGFNTAGWKNAQSVPTPPGTLRAQLIEPIVKMDTYTAISVESPKPGIYVFDFGQNMAGWTRMRVQGPPGTMITIQHSEQKNPDGTLTFMYSNSPMVDTYYLAGTGEEYMEPTFTYHGFQYAQVQGYPGVPSLDSIEAFFVHTALPEIGSIVFSNDVLNSVQSLTRFASRSNYMNIPTDCPQRERRGWLGDAQLSAETLLHNWGMGAAYTKFLWDISDEQIFSNGGGSVADCVPFYNHGGQPADPAWGTAYTLIWGWMYEYYGDTRILSDIYSGVKLHLDSLTATTIANGTILPLSRYGDWCSVDNGFGSGCGWPEQMYSTFYYLLELEVFANAAAVLGNAADAASYTALANRVRAAWNQNFFEPTTMFYQGESQTSQILALVSNVVTGADYPGVVNALVNNIINTNTNHLTVGIVGTKYILPALSALGRLDIAIMLATQTTYPSWGYWVGQGATTLWENWQTSRYEAFGSKNHIMFGGHGEWYYSGLAGIQRMPGTVGHDHLRIAPQVPAASFNLSHVSASINTYKGVVQSSWIVTEGPVCATVLEGSTATIQCLVGTITSITFASFGTPNGVCGAFQYSHCNSVNSMSVVQQACIGKSSCSVPANNQEFGGDPCFGTYKRLYIQVAGCSGGQYAHVVTLPAGSDGEVVVPTLGLSGVSVYAPNPVWQNNAFVPGTTGIFSASASATAITFQIGSGTYNFVLAGQPSETVCAEAPEGGVAELTCPAGKHVSSVRFASFGAAPLGGACGTRTAATSGCVYGSSHHVVETACLGRSACSVSARTPLFGAPEICPAGGDARVLYFEALCASA